MGVVNLICVVVNFYKGDYFLAIFCLMSGLWLLTDHE